MCAEKDNCLPACLPVHISSAADDLMWEVNPQSTVHLKLTKSVISSTPGGRMDSPDMLTESSIPVGSLCLVWCVACVGGAKALGNV